MANDTNETIGVRGRVEALLADIRDGTRLGPTVPHSRIEALLIDIRDGGGSGPDLSALGLSLDGSTLSLDKEGEGSDSVGLPVPRLTIGSGDRGVLTGVEFVDGSVPKHDTLAEYSLAELREVSADLTASGTGSAAYAKFQGFLGQTYDFGTRTGDYAGTGDDAKVIAQLVGICHDDLADGSGKAGLTFLCNRSLAYAYQMNSGNTNTGGWEASKMRTTLNSGEVWQSLPADLKGAAVAVLKQTNNVGLTDDRSSITITSDRFWLASACEMWGADTTEADNNAAILPYEGTQYAYFAESGITWTNYASLADRGKTNTEGTIQSREGTLQSGGSWLRSPDADGPDGFLFIQSLGKIGHGFPSAGRGVVIGFCI